MLFLIIALVLALILLSGPVRGVSYGRVNWFWLLVAILVIAAVVS